MTEATFSEIEKHVREPDPVGQGKDLEVATLPTSSTSSSATGTDSQAELNEDDLAWIQEEQEAQRSIILTSLSNQLEYYFSQQNLEKDTYLETLRSLNDGCVPVSILTNFQKIKSIVPKVPESTRSTLVVQAVGEYSEHLLVVYVDGQTGRMLEEGAEVLPTSILSICTLDKKALPPSPTARSTNQNSTTLILRDVHESVTEEQVRGLFAFDGCPSVESVRCDVANCWFVVLGTESTDPLVKVMEMLQAATLGGRPVHARRKASTTSTVPIDPAPLWLAPLPTRRKKKVRSKKRRGKKSSVKPTPDEGSTDKSKVTVGPPTLGEEDFPTLQDKQVEWQTPCELDAAEDTDSDKESTKDDWDSSDNRRSLKTVSDVASTATTTSSSTDSTPNGKKAWGSGGYAAALMQQVPPAVTENKPVSIPAASLEVPAPVVNVPKPTWGGVRSFAVALRKGSSPPEQPIP